MTIKTKLEKSIEKLIFNICRNSKLALLLVFTFFLFISSGVLKIEIDTSTEAFLHPNDPVLERYNNFKDQFGREDLIIIAITANNIFDLTFLEKLKLLHETIEDNVSNVDEINSLINARVTYSEDNQLVVGELLKDWPATPRDILKIKDIVNSNPLFINQLISKSNQVTTLTISLDTYSSKGVEDQEYNDLNIDENISIPYLTDSESRKTIKDILLITKEFNTKEFSIRVSGVPTLTNEISDSLKNDMRKFMILAILIIAACLMSLFRRFFSVAFPLVIVILSLISTLGSMGHLGVSVKIPTVILPSFLLAVGVGASVHILSIFLQKFKVGDNKIDAIVKSYVHSGLAIILTSITTAVGLASFSFAEVAAIADLGKFASLGILVSLLYTFTLLPALLVSIKIKPSVQSTDPNRQFFNRILIFIANLSINNSKKIVFLCTLFFLISFISATQLRFSHDPLGWMPRNSQIVKSTTYIDQNMGGSVVLEILLNTKRENGLHDKNILKKIDKLSKELMEKDIDPPVGKVVSLVDILKEIHRALNDGNQNYYKVPDDQNAIPQEFLLFEFSGSDDLETFVDSSFESARVSIRVPWRDALQYAPFLKETKKLFENEFKNDVIVSTTGMIEILSRTLEAAVLSAAKSYVIALVVISFLIILMVGNVKLGLICMLPNITPIVITMGLMYWISIPLNLFTMLIASIAIGLAVDDTIHFMHNFSREWQIKKDLKKAIHHTFLTSGRALLITTIVLSLGFYIFVFSEMNNIIQFGFLTGTAIILALISDFLFLPALLNLFLKEEKNMNKI